MIKIIILIYNILYFMTNLNRLDAKESTNHSSKTARFIENTKRAVHKALTTTWIVVSSFLPTSVNTITTSSALSWTAITSTIWIWAAASLFTACSSDNAGEELKDTTPPTISINKSEIDITWWKEIRIRGNMLYIWNELIATRNDDVTKDCKASLSFNWQTITYWTIVSEEWTLTLQVSDATWNTSKIEIKLNTTPESPISWLEKLKNLSLKVDQEIDLLKWVTLGNWVEISKVEIESDWQKTEISDPHHYTPEYPWTCTIIITIQDKDWSVTTHKVENLTVAPLEYQSISIKNLKPADILPIVGQVEIWDKKCYEHIEHLRVAEATKIRDMMWKYGTWSHSPEQYQQLMSRLHTGMTDENPKWYDNYEQIWWNFIDTPSSHAHDERNILNTLINHANFQIINDNYRRDSFYELISNNPNKIYIFWNSMSVEDDTNEYIKWDLLNSRKKACKSPNVIFLVTWTNIDTRHWIFKNKILHQDVEPDPLWVYWRPSCANWKNDSRADNHILVTIWTDAKWNVDQSDVDSYGPSRFPVWFHPDILFSGRAFPRIELQQWKIHAESWKYSTSYTNYLNVALMDLCFQMFAEIKDVDQLLDMIRSTSLTDYISLDWQTQSLHLINPAWFFQKYLMPKNIPSQIKQWEIIPLNKWYYKWIIFDIPWAEVKINWEWIAYNNANKSIIQNQNPMNLEWRLNGSLCKKLWYSPSKPIQWKIVVADDKRNGLNINSNTNISINH